MAKTYTDDEVREALKCSLILRGTLPMKEKAVFEWAACEYLRAKAFIERVSNFPEHIYELDREARDFLNGEKE